MVGSAVPVQILRQLIKAALFPKVQFLSQILDYNGHIWLEFEWSSSCTKNILCFLDPRRSIGTSTVCSYEEANRGHLVTD